MYYEMQAFYYRDVFFIYGEENKINYFKLDGKIESDEDEDEYIYHVDKIDKELSCYDILPTVGPYLVSKRFSEIFSGKIGLEIVLRKALIIDVDGNKNNDFFSLLVLNELDCIDNSRSDLCEKVFRDGSKALNIKKLIIDKSRTNSKSIFLLKEKKSFTVANIEFVKNCEKLKGFNFIELK